MATSGIGFTPGPSPGNRQPMSHVKVLCEGSTMRVDGQVTSRDEQPVASGNPLHLTPTRVGVRGASL
jgi:hypothetical protein